MPEGICCPWISSVSCFIPLWQMGQHPQWRHYRLDSMFGSMPSFLKGYIWLFTYVYISYVDIEYRTYYSIIKYNTVVHLFFAVEASYNSSFPRASNSQETTRFRPPFRTRRHIGRIEQWRNPSLPTGGQDWNPNNYRRQDAALRQGAKNKQRPCDESALGSGDMWRLRKGGSWLSQTYKRWLPGLVNIEKTMERSTIFYG